MTADSISHSFTDHDILIELRTKFDTFTTQYKIDVLDLKDGTAKTLAAHEAQINKNTDDIEKSKQWIHDYTANVRWWRFAAGGVGGILVLILNWLLPSVIQILTHPK